MLPKLSIGLLALALLFGLSKPANAQGYWSTYGPGPPYNPAGNFPSYSTYLYSTYYYSPYYYLPYYYLPYYYFPYYYSSYYTPYYPGYRYDWWWISSRR
jgi:hypothetical protein